VTLDLSGLISGPRSGSPTQHCEMVAMLDSATDTKFCVLYLEVDVGQAAAIDVCEFCDCVVDPRGKINSNIGNSTLCSRARYI